MGIKKDNSRPLRAVSHIVSLTYKLLVVLMWAGIPKSNCIRTSWTHVDRQVASSINIVNWVNQERIRMPARVAGVIIEMSLTEVKRIRNVPMSWQLINYNNFATM